ncbi:hypothetical protein GRW05_09510, partial [Escherichia coli]|nr:hypothetical protein [Escherichia coli]
NGHTARGSLRPDVHKLHISDRRETGVIMNFHHLAYWQDKALSVLIHEKYEKTGRTLDYSGFDGIRFGGACKPVEQILVVKP